MRTLREERPHLTPTLPLQTIKTLLQILPLSSSSVSSSSVGLENAEDKLRSDSVAEKEEKAIMPLSLPLFPCPLPGCVHSLWYIRDLGF